MLRSLSLFFLLCIGFSAVAQDLSVAQQDRLFHYSQIYGTVRYFHPYLAYRPIKWDEAWAAHAPAVLEAETDEEYARILELLFAELDDPSTKVVYTHTATAEPEEDPQAFTLNKGEDGTLVVSATSGYQLPDYVIHNEELRALQEELMNAKAIIFDWRFTEAYDPGWAYLDILFSWYEWEGALCAGTFRGPAKMKAYHRGFQPEDGTTSGGYFSGYTVELGKVYTGARSENIPVAFIVNDHSVGQLPGIAFALQAQGEATIINLDQGNSPTADEVYKLPYKPELSVQIRASEATNTATHKASAALVQAARESDYTKLIKELRSTKPILSSSNTEGASPYSGIPYASNYTEEAFPELGDRLLAAARIFTVIDLFFPYRDLMDRDWKEVTREFLPAFVQAENALDYQKAIFGYYHYIQDSHGGARGTNANLLFKELFGFTPPPFYTDWVEESVVIRQTLQDNLGKTQVGDIVLAKDGVPIKEIMADMRTYLAYSTEQAFYQRATQRSLCTPDAKATTYTIQHADGSVEDVTYQTSRDHYNNYQRPRTDTMRWLSDKIAYADLNILASSQVDDFFAAYGEAEALVFDMRGYPNGTAWAIAPRLSEIMSPELAVFNCPLVFGPNLQTGDVAWSKAGYQFMQTVPFREGPKYDGQIVVLINEDAVSQAEHTCLFLEQVADVTFIGSPTMGANGDVTNFIIPGGLRLSFSGQGVRHADGRQLQRMGIQPDIPCQPTVAGIRQGKDEILERAITYLKTKK